MLKVTLFFFRSLGLVPVQRILSCGVFRIYSSLFLVLFIVSLYTRRPLPDSFWTSD